MRDRIEENFMRENSNYLNRFDRMLVLNTDRKDESEEDKVDEVVEYINLNILKESSLEVLNKSKECGSNSYKSKDVTVTTNHEKLHIQNTLDTFVIYIGEEVQNKIEFNLKIKTTKGYKVVSKQIDNKTTDVYIEQNSLKDTELKIKVQANEQGVHKKRFKINLVGQSKKYIVLSFLIVFNNKK